MKRPIRLIPALLLVLLMVPGSARAAVVATSPGASFYGYTGLVFVADADAGLTYVNADIDVHDVVSDGVRTPEQEGAAHCFNYAANACPLFTSELIGVGATSEVVGLDDLDTGVYSFYCSEHPWMQAFLVLANT